VRALTILALRLLLPSQSSSASDSILSSGVCDMVSYLPKYNPAQTIVLNDHEATCQSLVQSARARLINDMTIIAIASVFILPN